jgi:hypothetical protein
MVKKKRATVVCFLGPVDKTNPPLLGPVATPREPEHFLTTKMAGNKAGNIRKDHGRERANSPVNLIWSE